MSFRKWLVLSLTLFSVIASAHTAFAFNLTIKIEPIPYAVFYPAKTYGWHPLSAVAPKFDEKIRAAMDRELLARGFNKATTGAPDIWVAYQFVRVDRTKQVTKMMGRGEYSFDEKKYREGTFTIDIFTPDQRHIIWRGLSESIYNPDLSDQKKMEMSDEAIKQIIAQLPPPG